MIRKLECKWFFDARLLIAELLMRLEKERLELREKRKRDKERLKATETTEEKRRRRLMKKEHKALKDKEKMGWDNDYVR